MICKLATQLRCKHLLLHSSWLHPYFRVPAPRRHPRPSSSMSPAFPLVPPLPPCQRLPSPSCNTLVAAALASSSPHTLLPARGTPHHTLLLSSPSPRSVLLPATPSTPPTPTLPLCHLP